MIRTVVLRFRDITMVDTISAHEEVIQRTGYVWWGWWKKAGENDRVAECEQLHALLRSGAVELGVFDRSTSRFFKAKAVDIVFESSGESIPSPESHNTPQYYESARVAAWIKFTKLERLTREDFTGQFGEVPLGDSTFFPISSEGLPAVLTSTFIGDEVGIMSPYLVHLSDLHFGGDFGFPAKSGPGKRPLLDMLLSDIAKLVESSIGILVVSGDFTTKADGNTLMTDSLDFLKELARRLNLQPQQVVLVPGNHDIPLRDWEPYSYKHETLMRLFLKEFYGQPIDGFMQLYRFKLAGGRKLEILTINSVHLRTTSDKNYGYVDWSLYDDFLRTHESDPQSLKMAVLHHHLVPAVTEELIDPAYPEAGISLTLDAGAVTEGLQSHGFRVALHGHQHIPGVTRIGRGRLQDDSLKLAGMDESLFVIAGGTTGSCRYSPSFKDNSYGLIQVKDQELALTVRRFSAASAPRTHFTATLGLTR
jgi:predicted phosphodiesterase